MADVMDDIFQDVMAGLDQVLAHVEGHPVLGMVIHEPGQRPKVADAATEGDADAQGMPQGGEAGETTGSYLVPLSKGRGDRGQQG